MRITVAFIPVLILFVVAALAPFLRPVLGKRLWVVIAGAPALSCAWFVSQLPGVIENGPMVGGFAVSEALGVDFAWRLDGLSLLFAILVTGIGALVMLYASSYMPGDEKEGRFYSFLGAFMASMLGLVLVDNILLIFVFWELTSITSYLLIGWVHKEQTSRTSALQALVTTGLGGLALLAGLVLLGQAAGTWSLGELISDPARIEAVQNSPLLPGILVCVLAGCFTKSAQFPFHYWLPNAMAAPTPVSAYLHSSTMVKAGVFLIARLNPVFDGVAAWSTTLTIFGGFTMVFAAYMGSRQTVLKKLLAYSTVSSLGLMVFMIGLGAGNHYALTAAMAYLLAHALFKATLFLVAGILTHETGVKDAEKLSGLWRVMPITFFAALFAALSMAGLPGLAGFQGKEFLLKATLDAPSWVWLLWLAAVVGAVWNVMIAFCVGWKPFYGRRVETPVTPHEPPFRMWAGPVTLAVLGIVGGLAPMLFAKPMVEATVASISPPAATESETYHTAAPSGYELVAVADDDGAHAGDGSYSDGHGYPIAWTLDKLLLPKDSKAGIALLSSLGAVGAGLVFFVARATWRRATAPAHNAWSFGPERGYFASLDGVLDFAKWQTKLLQSGYLSRYVLICICATIGLLGLALFRGGGLSALVPAIEQQWSTLADVRVFDGVLVALIFVGAVFTTVFRSRLAAVASLGLVGYAVATVFLVFGAPDIAMTQFAIETLTVIILVLVIYHLPAFLQLSTWRARSLDIVVAAVFGLVMTTLTLLSSSSTVGIAEPISEYFGQWAYLGPGGEAPAGQLTGRGRNVINVILVDFRVLDTMGEIVVLGIAAIGVYTLMKLRTRKPPPGPPSPLNDRDPMEETNVGLRRSSNVHQEQPA
ncbi:MAG: hydrogen gas-evolving membrane-bound hydrogenase subunit E [Planctomycetota bacterium]